MLKRLCAALLALLLVWPLTLAFAEGEAKLLEVRVRVDAPKGRTAPEGLNTPAVEKLTYEKEGELLEVPDYAVTLMSAVWSDSEGKPHQGYFVSGQTVVLTMIFLLNFEPLTLSEESAAFVNGEKAALKAVTVGEKPGLEISMPFVVEVGDDFKPEIRLFTDFAGSGSEEDVLKTFDGEEITISVRVLEPEAGVSYRYQWYRGGIAMEGRTEESIIVRNVKDSGIYLCSVIAIHGDREAEPVSSRTLTVEIKPLEVTVILEDAEKNVGDPDPRLSYTTEPAVSDDLIGAPARVQGEVVGEYAILVGTLSFGEDAKDNYTLLVKNGKFTIRGQESVAYAPADAIADESYIRGKNSSRIKIRVSKNSVPENARFHLTPAETGVEDGIRSKTKDALLKSFDISLVNADSKETDLLPGAHLKVQIPLTQEEEATRDYIYAAQYDPAGGLLYSYDSVLEQIGDTWYISFETDRLLPCALLQSEVKVDHIGSTDVPGEPTTSPGAWVWVVMIIPALLAVGVIVFALIWNKKKNAPAAVTPKVTAAPAKAPRSAAAAPRAEAAKPASGSPAPPPSGAQEPKKEPEAAPQKKRVVSFDDLED